MIPLIGRIGDNSSRCQRENTSAQSSRDASCRERYWIWRDQVRQREFQSHEAGEKQTFWKEFFEFFGIARKTVASFEAPVKKLTGHDGAIDLFWPGNLIVEHKSLGGNLGKAQSALT